MDRERRSGTGTKGSAGAGSEEEDKANDNEEDDEEDHAQEWGQCITAIQLAWRDISATFAVKVICNFS